MSSEQEDDLGKLLGQVLGVVLEREGPILEAHGLTMWEYVILLQLLGERGLTQKELARRSHRDPTRLIGHLDALGARGLIAREVDAEDRRRHTVRLTEEGEEVVRGTQRDIRAMEEDLLSVLPSSEQQMLRSALSAVLRSSSPPRTSSGVPDAK
jgi:DNA-binding MarR family transcriptional regulator